MKTAKLSKNQFFIKKINDEDSEAVKESIFYKKNNDEDSEAVKESKFYLYDLDGTGSCETTASDY